MKRLILALSAFLTLASAALAGDRTPNWGAAPMPVALTDKNGAQTDSSHPLPVTIAGSATALGIADSVGADSSGTFTNATQTTNVQAVLETGTTSYSTVTVTLNGTYGNASAVFEKSDDDTLTNWYPVTCSQEGQGVNETGYSLLTNTSRMWQCNTQGANAFRVRSTAVASGTANILISPSGMPTANGITVNVAPTVDATASGSLTAQDAGSTTTACQGASSCITGTATAASTVPISINGRTAISTQLSGTWVGTVQFEGSMDNGVTWTPFSTHVRGAAAATATATLNGLFIANTSGLTNYRVRWTTKTSGTVSVAFSASSEDAVVYVNNAIKLLGLDGVSQVTVKAASTPAAPTDTSVVVALADGGNVTLGAKADAKSTATDTTAVTIMQVLKEISAMEQAPAARALSASSANIGNINAATYGSSTTLVSNKVLKGSAGTLYSLDVVADATLYASTWYVLVFDATALPSNGAVTPAKCYPVPAGVPSFTAGWPAGGVTMTAGITIGVSSTGCRTLTASIHGDLISGDFQ